MSTLHKVYLGIIAVLVLGALYAVHAYQVAQTKAEAQQKATEQVLAAKDQALADRDKSFQDFKAQMLQQIADIKTQKQAVTVLQPIVQGASPQTVTKSELPADVQKQLPGDPSAHFTLLTDEQVVNLGRREKACELTEAGLTKCDGDKADLQAKIDALTKANADWAKAGKVGPWMVALGASRNAAGNGFSPNAFIQRRINSDWGVMVGVQGKGDLSLSLTHNFGGPK